MVWEHKPNMLAVNLLLPRFVSVFYYLRGHVTAGICLKFPQNNLKLQTDFKLSFTMGQGPDDYILVRSQNPEGL